MAILTSAELDSLIIELGPAPTGFMWHVELTSSEECDRCGAPDADVWLNIDTVDLLCALCATGAYTPPARSGESLRYRVGIALANLLLLAILACLLVGAGAVVLTVLGRVLGR